ncbi:hypothetical protein VB779_16395 [Haloarculaceae archaeon H-GB11]|nr:hypothetical protein [Haloarculaceae archaeon H-GB11]
MGESLTTVTVGLDRLRAGAEHIPLDPASVTGEAHVGSDLDRPTIMYVSAGLHGHNRTGPHFWKDDITYHEHQFELARTLVAAGDYDIVFKLSPKRGSGNPIEDRLADASLDDRIDIVRDTPFSRAVERADVVVMDRPTTVFLESMLLNKYIVCLDLGWFRWFEDTRRLVEDSVTVIETDGAWQQALTAELRDVFETGGEQSYVSLINEYCRPEYTPNALWQTLAD